MRPWRVECSHRKGNTEHEEHHVCRTSTSRGDVEYHASGLLKEFIQSFLVFVDKRVEARRMQNVILTFQHQADPNTRIGKSEKHPKLGISNREHVQNVSETAISAPLSHEHFVVKADSYGEVIK